MSLLFQLAAESEAYCCRYAPTYLVMIWVTCCSYCCMRACVKSAAAWRRVSTSVLRKEVQSDDELLGQSTVRVFQSRRTCDFEVSTQVFQRVVLKELLLKGAQRHVGKHDALAEGLEGLLSAEEGLLAWHADDHGEELDGFAHELKDIKRQNVSLSGRRGLTVGDHHH